MKISVMTFPFHNLFAADDKNIADFLQKIQAAGATGIETMFGWETKAPASWKCLCDTAKSLGIQQACYDIGINLIYSSREEYSDISARASEVISLAISVPYIKHSSALHNCVRANKSVPQKLPELIVPHAVVFDF